MPKPRIFPPTLRPGGFLFVQGAGRRPQAKPSSGRFRRAEPAGFGCAEAACGRPLPFPAFRILFTTCAGLG